MLTFPKDRDYRLVLQEALDDSHEKLVAAVENHISNTNVAINIDDLKSFPTGVWVNIGDKIKAKKRKNRFKHYLNFSIEMEPGAKFSEHFHNDTIESTEVEYGEILDTSTNKTYKAGDVAHYDEGIKHTPIAVKGKTLLHVLFKKAS